MSTYDYYECFRGQISIHDALSMKVVKLPSNVICKLFFKYMTQSTSHSRIHITTDSKCFYVYIIDNGNPVICVFMMDLDMLYGFIKMIYDGFYSYTNPINQVEKLFGMQKKNTLIWITYSSKIDNGIISYISFLSRKQKPFFLVL